MVGELGPPSCLTTCRRTVYSGTTGMGRRNQYTVGPKDNDEVTSLGVGRGILVRPEGRSGTLTMEIGSGPEGSSLTVDSQRSLGAGTEET